jgi:hypothetical protein
MQTIKTIGLDIAKSVFQVHGVDADGSVVVRRRPAPAGAAIFICRPLLRGARRLGHGSAPLNEAGWPGSLSVPTGISLSFSSRRMLMSSSLKLPA